MKLSISWLKTFLDIEENEVDQIAKKLTMGAFEVEDILHIGPSLKEPILIGEIKEIQKHPDADKLSVTKVTTDGKNSIQIICGAKNIEVGQKVPVSLPGAEVVDRKDGSILKIKDAKLRGVESFGMLCAPSELGIETETPDGILILEKDAPIGKSIIEHLSLKKDIVLEIGSRSNRGDALSVYGLSKEFSALTGKKIKDIQFNEPKYCSKTKSIKPKIENGNDTYVFYTATIENIHIQESPRWLKSLLTSIGIRSINNIVDITNYINITYGQPMHAYDKDKLNGDLISRVAKDGEKIITLDGKERDLKSGVLVIADNKSPVSIAGIMGGQASEVSEITKNIVFEAAVFSPQKIRKGSRAVGLASEASKRFERGVDSNTTYKALLKAIELTLELAQSSSGETNVSKIEAAGNPINKNLKIELTSKEIKRVLDINLTAKEVKTILEPLDFKCKEMSDDKLEVSIPTSRQVDITREIDLIEEVARLYGYDNIPTKPPISSASAGRSQNIQSIIKQHFIAAGFSETYLSSLIGERILAYKEFKFDKDIAIEMLNPLSKEHYLLRQTLLPGLLEALKLNQSNHNTSIKLFEVGQAFIIDKTKKTTERTPNVIEDLRIAGLCSLDEQNWFEGKTNDKTILRKKLLFKTKGIIESLLENHINFSISNQDFFHPKYSLEIKVNNSSIGSLGILHPQLEKNLDLTGPIALFEISLSNILSLIEDTKAKKSFSAISTQPIVERDLTFDVLNTIPSNDIKAAIEQIASKNLKEIALIGTYDLNEHTNSLTYRLKFQDFAITLTNKEVESEISKIIDHLTGKFEVNFRV